jgi:hypothetical protein
MGKAFCLWLYISLSPLSAAGFPLLSMLLKEKAVISHIKVASLLLSNHFCRIYFANILPANPLFESAAQRKK